MTPESRDRFDAMVETVLDSLPEWIHNLLTEAPLVVEDRPSTEVLLSLNLTEAESDELCGLYTGVSRMERSVDGPGDLPDVVHVFREGVLAAAGGWEAGDDAVFREVRITILHEIGHHFGLDEDDLDALGYA